MPIMAIRGWNEDFQVSADQIAFSREDPQRPTSSPASGFHRRRTSATEWGVSPLTVGKSARPAGARGLPCAPRGRRKLRQRRAVPPPRPPSPTATAGTTSPCLSTTWRTALVPPPDPPHRAPFLAAGLPHPHQEPRTQLRGGHRRHPQPGGPQPARRHLQPPFTPTCTRPKTWTSTATILQRTKAVVMVGSHLRRADCNHVASDNPGGAYLGVKHMIERGRRRIALVWNGPRQRHLRPHRGLQEGSRRGGHRAQRGLHRAQPLPDAFRLGGQPVRGGDARAHGAAPAAPTASSPSTTISHFSSNTTATSTESRFRATSQSSATTTSSSRASPP